MSMWRSIGRQVLQIAVREGGKHVRRKLAERNAGAPASGRTPAEYAGDHDGPVQAQYAPRNDGDADPGEVVWAFVPYEEDHSQGKDRPVLVIARDGDELLALPLTSKDQDRDADQERRAGRLWMDIGTGAWDRKRRPSEVRLNRVLRIRARDVRREGAALDRVIFERVVAAARTAGSLD